MDNKEKKRHIPLDAMLLSAAITEFMASRWTAGISSDDHPLMKESIRSSLGFFDKLFALRDQVTLDVTETTLTIDGVILDKSNPFLQDFARIIHAKDIGAVTFSSGITIKELLEFHKLVLARNISAYEPLPAPGELHDLTHIRFSPFVAQEITDSEVRTEEIAPESQPWKDYIHALLEGELAGSDAEVLISNIPPAEIASFISDNRELAADSGIPDKIVALYLSRTTASGVRPDLFEKFVALMNSLSREVKRQFILKASATFKLNRKEIASLADSLTTAELGQFIDMFSNLPGRAPEPLGIYGEILQERRSPSSFYDRISDSASVIPGCEIELDRDFVLLFDNTHFDQFDTGGYRRELGQFLDEKKISAKRYSSDAAKDFREDVTEQRFAEIILDLLAEKTITRDDYLILLTRLAGLGTGFMETGRFDDFVDVYNAIFSDALSGKYRTEASSMLDYIYHTESFIARSVESIKLWGKHEWPSAVRLADAQRRHLLGPLFDALADEEDSSMRGFLLELIGRLKFDVLEEAVTRLEDNRWYVVRNMINVIRKMEGNRFSDRIARFMNHPNPKVAMEAVETLMYFKHPDVLTTLRKILYGDDLELRDEAIRLAGLYKVREAVPPLLSLLERTEYSSSGTSYKLLVVKSLHEIGDPRAIDSFVRVFRSDTLLNGPALDDLKTAIFEGLSNYSPDTVKPLLLLGSRSSVSAVRSISEELLKTIGSQ